jgi:hypothetical protein
MGSETGGYSRTAFDLPPGETPNDGGSLPVKQSAEQREISLREAQDNELLQRAREMHSTSTSYLETNVLDAWERSLAHFRNEHAPRTRYTSAKYRKSRHFRPKTRSAITQHEAAVANALFSTWRSVDVQPEDPTQATHVVSAKMHQALAEYHLKHSIPWFLTSVGGFQDTKVYGIAVSHNYWEYRTVDEWEPAYDEEGNPVTEVIEGREDEGPVPMGRTVPRPLRDRPVIDLVEPENFRFDPMADWRDPAGTSPYLIAIFPMYAGDVLERSKESSSRPGQKPWRRYDIAKLVSTRNNSYNRTRQAREGENRNDPATDQTPPVGRYTTIWVHLNIFEDDGTDYAYWTAGTDLVLSDPVPLRELYPHLRDGERPFVVGTSVIEAHRNYPASDAEQAAPVQTEINDLANQRMDNIRLVLNKRYYIRRGSQVDLEALMRNVSGGGVMMNDPERDVKTVDTRDVTSSSYAEQERLSGEYDALVGSFNPAQGGGPQSVGGMQKAGSTAGAVQDYKIQTYIETFIEPTLSQLVRMIAYYESDERRLALAERLARPSMDEGNSLLQGGISEEMDYLLRQQMVVRVNAGMGNTDPQRRLERLVYGIDRALQLPGVAERLKPMEVVDEVFGTLGYRDGSRFFMNDDEYAEMAEQAGDQTPPDIALKQEELSIRREENKMRNDRELQKIADQRELEYAKLAQGEEQTVAEIMGRLGVAQRQDKTKRDVAALDHASRAEEMNLRRATGSGI